MILKLCYYGDPVLRQKAKPVEKVTSAIKQFIRDLTETMDANHGQGIAAPQVGKLLRIFICRFYQKQADGQFKLDDTATVVINPKIVSYGDEVWTMNEGCLSLPGIDGDVERPHAITLEYMDENEKMHTVELEGLHSRVVLHENDHLNGVLHIDRVKGRERKRLDKPLQQLKQKYAHTWK